jgi:type I restriction enzyme R subunit
VLDRLNPALPPEAISRAIDQPTYDRPSMSLVATNRKVYGLLKGGGPVPAPAKAADRKSSGFVSSVGAIPP